MVFVVEFYVVCAIAGYMCGFYFLFSLNGMVCSRLDIPTACATAGFKLDLLIIFIDPCAGRHLLLLLRQKK